jgi:hypothetical protein
MAYFYGWLRGEKGKKVTHTGSDTSGLNGVLNGYSFGVRVSLFNDGKEDKAEIFLTGGSNEKIRPVSIGFYNRLDLIKNIRNKKF